MTFQYSTLGGEVGPATDAAEVIEIGRRLPA